MRGMLIEGDNGSQWQRSKDAPINVQSVAIARSTAENERKEGQATDSVGNWIVTLTSLAREHQSNRREEGLALDGARTFGRANRASSLQVYVFSSSYGREDDKKQRSGSQYSAHRV